MTKSVYLEYMLKSSKGKKVVTIRTKSKEKGCIVIVIIITIVKLSGVQKQEIQKNNKVVQETRSKVIQMSQNQKQAKNSISEKYF